MGYHIWDACALPDGLAWELVFLAEAILLSGSEGHLFVTFPQTTLNFRQEIKGLR